MLKQDVGSPSQIQSLKRALGYLNSYRWMGIGALLSLLLFIAANALTPQLFRWGIDQGIAKKDLDVVFQAGSLLICVAIARGVSNFGQGFWAEAVAQGVAYRLRNQIFQKIQNLSFSYHDRAPTSQLLTRITRDIEQIRTFIGTTLLQVISSILTLVTITVILLVMNWQLALITLTAVPIAAFLLFRFFSKAGMLFGRVQQLV